MLQTLKKSVFAVCIAVTLVPATQGAVAQNKVYHAVVARDGTGQFTTIQSAIDAAPAGRTSPWLIFIKNGSYHEQVVVGETKRFIHLIGQDREKTVIHYKLNVGGRPAADETPERKLFWEYSVHNPQSSVYKWKGSVVTVEAADFYAENISFVNDFGKEHQNGPQALAMKSQGDRISFHNCKFISYQDTWMTTKTDAHRLYAKDCYIEGAVDYFYGSGDALLEHCTLYNVRSGAVIVAPCQKDAKFGYVFHNCIIDSNESAANGTIKLGRPWHHSPRAVYINTTMRVPVAPEGWTNMGTIPALFAEYNSRDSQGNLLDLSKRKTEYQGRDAGKEQGSCRAVITKEEAELYSYQHVIPGTDGWNPRAMMQRLPAPEHVNIKKGVVQWKEVPQAIGYVIFRKDEVLGITNDLTYKLPQAEAGEISVCAINTYGSLGELQRGAAPRLHAAR